jgi:surfeit locus 1 family protein
MRIGAYRFRPGLWPTLATVTLLPILLSLGFWQLDRAGEKRAFLASLEAGRQAPPVQLNGEQPAYERARHRSVQASGRYDSEHQFLLENQIRDGRPGYLVLTPLQLEGSDAAVLVDRGWVAAEGHRDRLPRIDAPSGHVEVAGVLDSGPAVGLRLGEPAAEEGWPRRLQYLDYPYVADNLPYRILPYLVHLDPAAPDGFRRDWEPVAPMGPQTHRGYAVQWFGLAVALVVIYLVVNIKRGSGRD